MLLKLHITKEDIQEAIFTDSNDCPITRALARAGFPQWKSSVDNLINRNYCIPPINLFEAYTASRHPVNIANHRIMDMQRKTGLLSSWCTSSEYKEDPADIDIEFEVEGLESEQGALAK